MSLQDQKDPIVSVQEEKGKTEWVDGVEDDEIMRNLNNQATGHISRDRACTRIEVTQLAMSMWTEW